MQNQHLVIALYSDRKNNMYSRKSPILVSDGANSDIEQQVKTWCERMEFQYEGWHLPHFKIDIEPVPNDWTLRSGNRVFLPGSSLVEITRTCRGSFEYVDCLSNKIDWYSGSQLIRKLVGSVRV